MLVTTVEDSADDYSALVNMVSLSGDDQKGQTWISDSGATKHISPHRGWFRNYLPTTSVKIRLGNGHVSSAIGKGDIQVETIVDGKPVRCVLTGVLHVPDSRL